MGNVCPHGSLARKCLACEVEAERDALRVPSSAALIRDPMARFVESLSDTPPFRLRSFARDTIRLREEFEHHARALLLADDPHEACAHAVWLQRNAHDVAYRWASLVKGAKRWATLHVEPFVVHLPTAVANSVGEHESRSAHHDRTAERARDEAEKRERVLREALVELREMMGPRNRQMFVMRGPQAFSAVYAVVTRALAAVPEPAGETRPTCEMPGCGKPIPEGGGGAPEVCHDCIDAENDEPVKRDGGEGG